MGIVNVKGDAANFREMSEQFRKLADLSDKVADAYDADDVDAAEEAMKNFMWEFVKMQNM